MAPLPDNNTPVLFIDYTSGGVRHTAEVRLPAGASSGSAALAYTEMALYMKAYMLTSDSILGGRWRASGANVTLPLAVSPVSGTVAGTADPDKRPNFTSWVGRSADGRRVRFTMYTALVDVVVSGYRDNSPSTAENNILTALQSANVGAKTISGSIPVWQPYVNYGVNAYFQRKVRRTG